MPEEWNWEQLPDGTWQAYSQKTHWYWHVVPFKPDQRPDSWLIKGQHWTWDEDEWRWFGVYLGLDNAKRSARQENDRDHSNPLYRLYRPRDDDDEDERG